VDAPDAGEGREDGRVAVTAVAHDLGRFTEGAMLVDLTAEEEDERLVLGLLGIDL
jgi:hypothetical protein